MGVAYDQDKWRRAVDLASAGRLEEAHEIFVLIAQEDPEDAGVWRWLANVTSDPRARIRHLEKALELNVEDSSTRGELHQALVRQGVSEAQSQRLESARSCFEQASEVLPNDELALLWLVEVSDSVQDRVELLERLFELQPRDASIRSSLAVELARLGERALEKGERALAASHFKRAFKMDAENLDVLFRIAEADDASLGKRLEMLSKVLTKRPDHEAAKRLWDVLSEQALQESSTLPINACSLCRGPKEATSIECGTCGALLSFFDLDKLLSNPNVDVERLTREVRRLEELNVTQEDWRLQKNLLLARLNLGQKTRAAKDVDRLLEMIPLNEPERLEIEQVRLFLLRDAEPETAAVEPENAGEGVDAQLDEERCVLVVDDSPTVRSLVGATLEADGYEVVFAGTGMEALASLRQTSPDLVLLDIGLPNMDGYQLCQLMRQNPATAEVPVVMLSARDGFFDQVRGRMVGCQDFITKPFDPEDLLDRVGQLIS